MKKEFLNEEKSILIYTCDNLGEYFAEFAKYRKAVRESDDWDKGFNDFYGENARTFKRIMEQVLPTEKIIELLIFCIKIIMMILRGEMGD